MFDELLGFGLMLVFVSPFVCIGGIFWVRTVLEGFLVLFWLIAEVRRRDETDDLFERVIWVPAEEEVYESGYGTE